MYVCVCVCMHACMHARARLEYMPLHEPSSLLDSNVTVLNGMSSVAPHRVCSIPTYVLTRQGRAGACFVRYIFLG